MVERHLKAALRRGVRASRLFKDEAGRAFARYLIGDTVQGEADAALAAEALIREAVRRVGDDVGDALNVLLGLEPGTYDIEFMAELLIGVMHGPQGGSPKTIDEYYSEYEDYETEIPGQRRNRRIFDETMSLITESLEDLRDSRWSNKSDFYSLFVAIASLIRQGKRRRSVRAFASILDRFAENVEKALEYEDARVPAGVRRYVQNVQRGANDKTRRAERHAVLLDMLGPTFK